MARFERDVVVACPPDRVFDVLSRIERLPEFSEMTTAVRGGPGRPIRVGDRFEQVVKVAGVELDTQWEVVEATSSPASSVIRVDGTSPGDGTATVTHRLVPQGSGTHVTFTVDYDPPYGVLGDLADKLVFERRNGEDAERILERLKELCERPA